MNHFKHLFLSLTESKHRLYLLGGGECKLIMSHRDRTATFMGNRQG